MHNPGKCTRLTLFLLILLAVPRLWAQGPPFSKPMTLCRLICITMSSTSSAPWMALQRKSDSSGPAFEFKLGKPFPGWQASCHSSVGSGRPIQ